MAASQMNEVIRHLRRTVLLRDGAGLTDGQLLEDYVCRREQAALEVLVHRHGPMVWGVCMRILRNHHDAEDAFQATFLVLVRKAASIASPKLLANWLYGVAQQTALKARATAATRRTRERQVTEMPESAAVEQVFWNDLQTLLDQELSRLPDMYRVAIVLCDLEGRTRKEAARQLGVPEGTLAARVARGRVMLAKRLAGYGLIVSGGALGMLLAQNISSAAVPTSVVSNAIKAATLFAAGPVASGVISTEVATLVEGVMKSMLLNKLKLTVAVIIASCVVGIGATVLSYRTVAAEPPAPQSKAATPRQDEGNLKETVLALQKRLWEANAKQDVNALKNLLADDFTGLDKHDNPFNKGDVLQYVSEWCEYDHSIKEAKVILLNNSSALVSCEVHYKTRRTKSKEVFSTEARQGTVAWAKRNGQWWCIYSQSHSVSPGKNRFLEISTGESKNLIINPTPLKLEKIPPKD